MRTKTKFSDDEVVVAWQGFAAGSHTVATGTRLRADHPAVRQCPQYFVRDGVPESEWPWHLDGVIAANDAAAQEQIEPVSRIALSTPLGNLMICRQQVISSRVGGCPAGRVVLDTDPIVAAAPEAFVRLADTLGGEVTPLMSMR